MAKFFIDRENLKDDYVEIDKDNANHIINALRCKIGEEIEISIGDGYDYICKISKIEQGKVIADIVDCFGNESEPKTKITLYQGLPKSEKMELIIQKCVELGIDTIVPVVTDRTIVKLSGKEEKKVARWNKISESASKQSRRGKIPKVESPITFKEAILKAKENNMNIIPYEKEEKTNIKSIIKDFKGDKIGVFIGPEGGFSEKEIELAKENSVIPITLGRRILRTETAGFVTTNILLYELEE